MKTRLLRLKFLVCLFVLVAAVSANAEKPAAVIREEQPVLVDGVEERWVLQWEGPTKPHCSFDKPNVWPTCPCSGFAFGECGKLALVRKRPGQEDERIPLSNMFQECPSCGVPGDDGEGCLQRWAVHQRDLDEKDAPDFAAKVKARPIVRIMDFLDYDHDGRATEFMLQVDNFPCAKPMCVVIGISRKNPHLHVFGSAAFPNKPLVLQAHQWESLLEAKGPVTVIDWRCGDHGADVEIELELRIDNDGIHAMRIAYECTEDGARGRLLTRCLLEDDSRCEEELEAQQVK